MRIKLGRPLMMSDIINTLGIRGGAMGLPPEISYITTRSSLCERGDLFIALVGQRYDGGDFLTEARARGAVTLSERCENTDLTVRDSEEALLKLSTLYISRLPYLRECVAITGSVGKTTTRELIHRLTEKSLRVHSTSGNLNNKIGVPLTVLTAPSDTEILLLEAGMNRAGELKCISDAIHPTLSVITNIGSSHIGCLGGADMVARAKLEILSGMKKIRVITPYGCKYTDEAEGAITVSVGRSSADYQLLTDGGKFSFLKGDAPIYSFSLDYFGEHIPYCLAHALAVCDRLGITNNSIRDAIQPAITSLSRMKRIDILGITLLDDSYNASPESVKMALRTLSLVNAKWHIALLGDMLELGAYTEEYHEQIGRECAERCDFLITFGVFSEFIIKGARSYGMRDEKIIGFNDYLKANACAEAVLGLLSPGDALLIKASHRTGLTDVLKIIKERLGIGE
ncbi:MAG: UDP-N-acetylmuramoyl-tripeptide--D-alanyl-D-alanine ligase [Clostridia bacterium]|nr:UDP-N-acetylmuramoyl-tripeptide--D-alanyl-D-alanine ligase [Clostridia bacterium]